MQDLWWMALVAGLTAVSVAYVGLAGRA